MLMYILAGIGLGLVLVGVFVAPDTDPVEFEEAIKEDQRRQRNKVRSLYPKKGK